MSEFGELGEQMERCVILGACNQRITPGGACRISLDFVEDRTGLGNEARWHVGIADDEPGRRRGHGTTAHPGAGANYRTRLDHVHRRTPRALRLLSF